MDICIEGCGNGSSRAGRKVTPQARARSNSLVHSSQCLDRLFHTGHQADEPRAMQKYPHQAGRPAQL